MQQVRGIDANFMLHLITQDNFHSFMIFLKMKILIHQNPFLSVVLKSDFLSENPCLDEIYCLVSLPHLGSLLIVRGYKIL